MYIDLGADQLIAAEQGQVKIAVEIKSFISPSSISDFHLAHGQFLDYRYALEEQDPERLLYLAIPLMTYETFFQLKFIRTVVQRSQIKLLVFDPVQEVIATWIE